MNAVARRSDRTFEQHADAGIDGSVSHCSAWCHLPRLLQLAVRPRQSTRRLHLHNNTHVKKSGASRLLTPCRVWVLPGVRGEPGEVDRAGSSMQVAGAPDTGEPLASAMQAKADTDATGVASEVLASGTAAAMVIVAMERCAGLSCTGPCM